MSVSLMLPDDFEDTPAMLDEKRKHFAIRQVDKEVDWSDTQMLIVDMPPGIGEEVRSLLQLHPDAAVVVTAPQLISESAVRKVVVMVQEYGIPLLGLLQNNPNSGDGQAGRRLSQLFRLPLLAEGPWSPNILSSMEGQEPFDHQAFLPVAQALAATILAPPAPIKPITEEQTVLLREAEEWLSGEQRMSEQPTPRPRAGSLGVFVGEGPEAELSGGWAGGPPEGLAGGLKGGPAGPDAEPHNQFQEMSD